MGTKGLALGYEIKGMTMSQVFLCLVNSNVHTHSKIKQWKMYITLGFVLIIPYINLCETSRKTMKKTNIITIRNTCIGERQGEN